ncbi:MAG: hypothetical protein KKG04_01895 [Candidatus Thermoplasmatota archaeon]|nr:hypothetical protein [Candidatus Thermoplasmatota archaeon]
MKLQSYLCVLLSIVLVTVAFSSVIGKQSQDRTTLSSTPLFSIRTNQALKQTTSITPSITYLCDNQ